MLALSVVVIGLSLPAAGLFETNLQDTEVDYLATARQNYEAGEAEFNDENYNEAIKFFEYVKNKYPYSKYAVLADLRVADAHFAREEWVQAADAYRLFVRYHPSHEQVPYASFRTALSYYKETAKDPLADVWLIGPVLKLLSPFPPVRERDQTATKDAIQAFDEYLARYPDDANAEEARTLRLEARTKLAEHDLYAAEFYIQRERYRGAVWRYLHIADTYRDTSLAPAALEDAAELALDDLEEPAYALEILERLVRDHPESDEGKAAATRIEALRTRVADEQKAKEAAAQKKREEQAKRAEEAARRDAAPNDDAGVVEDAPPAAADESPAP